MDAEQYTEALDYCLITYTIRRTDILLKAFVGEQDKDKGLSFEVEQPKIDGFIDENKDKKIGEH